MLPNSASVTDEETGMFGANGLPEGEDASFFLCKELREGYLDDVTGEYATPSGYFVEPLECEEFDDEFPPKEKKRMPGQLW